jgi:hypothetical protein
VGNARRKTEEEGKISRGEEDYRKNKVLKK